MNRFDPILALSQLLDEDRERLVRLWSKRLRAELHELDLPGAEIREPLARHLAELSRLLRDRGEEAVRLWPESVRSHGIQRYDQRFDADDLAREFKALQQVLLHVYGKRHGLIEPELAELVAELIGEAVAAVQASYARVLRTEEVRFKEAAVMESVLFNVNVGIVLAELDGSLSYATPAVARLTGVPVRALVGPPGTSSLGATLGQLNARHLDGRPYRASELPFTRALKERSAVTGSMAINRLVGGEEAIIEMNATPIWEEGPEGELVGVIQTMTDRTETAQKSRELSNAYDELRRLQGRLLQRTRAQALGQLASGAAHALNNFLNVIRLRVTLLRRDFKPEHLDALDRTVGNIGDLVARLQDFSMVRTEEEQVDVDVDQVVREALELARPELSRNEHLVRVETHLEAGARVHLDPALLRELVVNLLLAAHDRLPKGGKVTLRSRRVDGRIDLRIEDTGAPYSAEDAARLFDPLKGKSRTPQLSLLLAVGRNQVQRWAGELTCEPLPPEGDSNEARGVAFRVQLPVAEGKAAPPLQRSPAPAPLPPRRLQRTRRVMVVDDDSDNARMMAEVLLEEGYEVQVAHSGVEALQLWDARPFDAALLDALMPDMSGWEVARALRQRSPQVLLAMVTGLDVRGQNRNNLALVDAVFRKPIDVGALDEFLSQSELRRTEQPSSSVPT